MLLTPHTLVGITVASAVPNPFVSVPLSFLMHFLGDKVPHWDFYSNTRPEQRTKGWRLLAVMGDFGVGLTLGLSATLYALWAKGNPALALNIFLCCIASNLPDALEVPYTFLSSSDPFSKFIVSVQHRMQFQAKLPWGIISQVAVVLVCLMLLSGLLLRV